MARFPIAAALAVALVVPSIASAQEHGQIGAFGGFTFGNTSSATTFGGSLGAQLTDNLQVVAEGGRLEDVRPRTLATLLDFTPVDLRVSAWYGEAGVRLIASPRSAVTPYAEATAGFARLRSGFAGVGRADPFINTALRFFDRTEPLLGVGGGLVIRGGPLTLDLGYRYKKIIASDSLPSLLTGDAIDVSQARIGVGVRF
jgi:opacity protein-like surface antigen